MKKVRKIVDKIMEWIMLFGIVLMFGILFFAPLFMSFYYEILCADLAIIGIPLFYAIESYDLKK